MPLRALPIVVWNLMTSVHLKSFLGVPVQVLSTTCIRLSSSTASRKAPAVSVDEDPILYSVSVSELSPSVMMKLVGRYSLSGMDVVGSVVLGTGTGTWLVVEGSGSWIGSK